MAAETYYFFFSIILVLGITFHITNMVYFRFKDKTVIGNAYRHNTTEYGRLKKFSNTRGLTISFVAMLIILANLVFDVYRIVHLQDHAYAHFILIFAPLVSILGFFAASVHTYNKFGKNQLSKRR